MNYLSTLVYHILVLIEAPFNILLALFNLLGKVQVLWSMDWLVYMSYIRLRKESASKTSIRDIKAQEAKQLEKLAFTMDRNGKDV